MTHQQPKTLKKRADIALHDDFLRKAVRFTTDRLRGRKEESSGALGDWEEWRERGRQVRIHTVANLDYYLGEFTKNMETAGGHMHFAADADEARKIVAEIADSKNTKIFAKSKSMISEEVHLNHMLEEKGIKVVETDLGEWIVQLAHETPSHIIIPAIHKNKSQIQELFEDEGHEKLAPETKVLAGFARRRMRETFEKADIGMTGCNFAIAESGSVVMFSNEGNARMVSTLPKTQIIMMGMERVLPTWVDLELMANLLPRSATGQKLTVYMSAVNGPRRAGELDGPEEVHVVVLDNGRSKILGDPEFQDVLNCIRCGACLNVCPVYRQVGGHAYGSVYPGPIGAVLTPLIAEDKKAWGELAYASSLCGACYVACPVKIPLHDMLVHLRRRHVEAGYSPVSEKIAFAGFGAAAKSSGVFNSAANAARWVQLHMIGDRSDQTDGPHGLETAGPVAGWSNHRALPSPQKESFHDLWKLLKDEPAETPGGTDGKRDTHGA